MRSGKEFATLKGVGQLFEKIWKKDIVYPLVYLLVIFSFILLVMTSIVEKYFQQ